MPLAAGSSTPDGVPSGDPDLDVLMKFVGILRDTRHQRGLTLRDLTGKMGINFAHLSRAERGLTQPGLVVLMRWCRALNLRFEDVWRQSADESKLTEKTRRSPCDA